MAKILIVEDNPDNMKLFRAVLTIRGHQVVGLPGGETLLETMRAETPAIVLLDIQLPGEDGFQLLAKLRAALADTLPPVVALTAHAMSGDEEKALTAGFTGYLTKPIDVGTFASTVEAFIPPA
ncbi:MAG: response regulator [Gemmatimonadales bacterium]